MVRVSWREREREGEGEGEGEGEEGEGEGEHVSERESERCWLVFQARVIPLLGEGQCSVVH